MLPADVLAARLDMRREVMETLLSYLEVRWTVALSCSAVACSPARHALPAVCSEMFST